MLAPGASQAVAPALDLAGRVLPDYGGRGLLDLLGWIRARLAAQGGRVSPGFAPALRGTGQRLVLLLLDGLGDDYLCRSGVGSALHGARAGALTTVFPSTTAAAITSVMTGLSPASHGLNGWTCRGHGALGLFEPLPMVLCADGQPLRNSPRRHRLFPYPTLYQQLDCASIVLSPARLVNSAYSRRHSRGAGVAGYQSVDELPAMLDGALDKLGARGLIYAYVPHFDATAHDEGMGSDRLANVFARLDGCFERMRAVCRRRGATLLATADHGMVDAPPDEMICLGAVPGVPAMLRLPLWGERRAAFFALRAGAEAEFRAAIGENWPRRLDLLSRREVLAAGLLGPGTPHRDLATRIGDGVLLPRGQGTVVDAADPLAVHPLIAVHGGLSRQEMEIPLVVAAAG